MIGPSEPTGRLDALRLQTKSSEIHWCVDRSWKEPKEIRLCAIAASSQATNKDVQIRDDAELCQRLTEEYKKVRTWKGRFLSWKRCLAVEFIKVSKVSHDASAKGIQIDSEKI